MFATVVKLESVREGGWMFPDAMTGCPRLGPSRRGARASALRSADLYFPQSTRVLSAEYCGGLRAVLRFIAPCALPRFCFLMLPSHASTGSCFFTSVSKPSTRFATASLAKFRKIPVNGRMASLHSHNDGGRIIFLAILLPRSPIFPIFANVNNEIR